jgi:hypothetical protein
MKLSGHYIILQNGLVPVFPVDFFRGKSFFKDELTTYAASAEIYERRRFVQNAAPMSRFLSPRVVAFYM